MIGNVVKAELPLQMDYVFIADKIKKDGNDYYVCLTEDCEVYLVEPFNIISIILNARVNKKFDKFRQLI